MHAPHISLVVCVALSASRSRGCCLELRCGAVVPVVVVVVYVGEGWKGASVCCCETYHSMLHIITLEYPEFQYSPQTHI